MPFHCMSIKFLYHTKLGRLFMSRDRISDDDRCIQKAKNDASLANDQLLARYVHSVPRAIRFKGVLLQGYLVYPSVLRSIESFEVRADDVWLCTYPKSGTTWTEEILSLMFAEGDLRQHTNRKLLAARVPHLEVGKPLGHLRWLRSRQSPRLLATHLNADSIPEQLRQAKAKIIYVVRNPKDTAVSYYHHHRMSSFLGNYSGSWADFLQLFSKGQLVYGDWFEHLHGYWQLCRQHGPDRVMVLAYEELKVNLPGMIQLMAHFLGLKLSPERIHTIAELCSFEQMRANAMVNREVLPVPDLFDMSQSKFMRKGIIGDWINYFTEQQSQHFDQLYRDRLETLPLRLAFDQHQAQQIMAENGGRIIQ